MVKLDRESSGLDISGVQPYLLTWSENWCWGALAITSLSLYSLGVAHLSSEVVVDLLYGGGGGKGIGISSCRCGGG